MGNSVLHGVTLQHPGYLYQQFGPGNFSIVPVCAASITKPCKCLNCAVFADFFFNCKILLKTPEKLLWELHPIRGEKGGDIYYQFPRGMVVEGQHCHLPGYQGRRSPFLPGQPLLLQGMG